MSIIPKQTAGQLLYEMLSKQLFKQYDITITPWHELHHSVQQNYELIAVRLRVFMEKETVQ